MHIAKNTTICEGFNQESTTGRGSWGFSSPPQSVGDHDKATTTATAFPLLALFVHLRPCVGRVREGLKPLPSHPVIRVKP